ncbi:MAG: hypothetical protein AABW59_05285 [archaeon]
MRALVLAEKKKFAEPFVTALEERGVNAKYLRISKVSLVSRKKGTLIKSLGKELAVYDGVFIQVRLSLAPFIEPLLEELKLRGTYVNVSPGSYYMGFNEPYQFVALAQGRVNIPRTITSGSGQNIQRISKHISYPLVAKSFKERTVQQSLVVNNGRDLNSFVKSIRTEMDGFMLREFIEDDVISCAVIGEKIYAIKRKMVDDVPVNIDKGTFYRPTEKDQENAILAAKVSGYDIARVDMVKGKVIDVKPIVPWAAFNKVCSENMEENVALFLAEQMKLATSRLTLIDDLKEIKGIISRTIFGRFLK